MKKDGELIIYKSRAGGVEIKTHFKDGSIWLSQKEIANLFCVDRTVIGRHIKNIYKTDELREMSTCAKYAHVGKVGDSSKRHYETKVFNLDMIISVGYRVNSKKATDFRIWATKTLRNYLVKGYAINEKRLLEQGKYFDEVKKLMGFITNKITAKELEGHEKEILDVIEKYTKTWKVLGEYDEGKIEVKKYKKAKYVLNYYGCREIIEELKRDLASKKLVGDLFGNEREKAFEGILGNLYQTFGGQDLYNSVEEKAAHLIYFVIKDHPFSDGNKRIGSLLFLHFLNGNNFLFNKNGEVKISDRTLVALALFVACSEPREKESITRLIVSLIQD